MPNTDWAYEFEMKMERVPEYGGRPGHVYFFVPGRPASQGSKSRNRHGAMFESDQGLKPWRRTVAGMAQATQAKTKVWEPFTNARVGLLFVFSRPKNHYNVKGAIFPRLMDAPHTVKPDVDKLSRAVLDGLTQGGILEDDARVRHLSAGKMYVNDMPNTDRPGCWISIQGS